MSMMNNGPIRGAELEIIAVDDDTAVERVSCSYDLICVVAGSCRYVDCAGEHEALRNSIHILVPGSRMVEYRVGSSGLLEIVVLSIRRDALFGRVDCYDREEERFEAAVLSGLASNISVEALATMCCHSVSTFKRRFRERYGVSPHRWFLAARLDIAQRILRETHLPTNVIAELCGFINVSHFIATFRRRFGCTPSRVMYNGAL